VHRNRNATHKSHRQATLSTGNYYSTIANKTRYN
jgi:hypothetical protein